MSAAPKAFVIEKNAGFSKVLIFKDKNSRPVNLTGYAANMQIRTNDGALQVDMSTANGRITIGGTDGSVTLSIPASITSTLNFVTAAYDLLLTPAGGQPFRLLEGRISLSPGVTVI